MDPAEAGRLEALRTECGCRAGAWAVLLALLVYAVRAWLEPAGRGWRSRLLWGAGVALAAAVAGKVLGILWARLRYRWLASRVGGPAASPSRGA